MPSYGNKLRDEFRDMYMNTPREEYATDVHMFLCEDCKDEQVYIIRRNIFGYDTVECIECGGTGKMV